MFVAANAVKNSHSSARRGSREANKLKIPGTHGAIGALASQSGSHAEGDKPFRIESSVGVQDESASFFANLQMDPGTSDRLMARKYSACTAHWERFASGLLQNDSWCRVKLALKTIPPDISEIFDEAQKSSGVEFDVEKRKLYYHEFFKFAAGFDVLHSAEVEFLIQEKLDVKISQAVLQDIIEKVSKASATETKDFFDFEIFINVMCNVLQNLETEQDHSEIEAYCSIPVFRIPIDPESPGKQCWDLFCLLLLLYCSFSIPYTIAFVEQNPHELDIFDSLLDALFMFDIGLSFLTAYDNKGYMVRDLHEIARNYLRTWFLPDLAGSFPIAQITVAVLDDQQGVESTNFIRMLKLVRMLKMVRAVKFFNRLNRLQQQEGLEQFGHVLGVFSALFSLIFAAHVLGCFFTLMLLDDGADNWLHHYRPELVDAENWVRYVTALYWAIITISTMGYGDILPVTHHERIFTIFVSLIGAITFSYCMGTISSLISQYTNVDDRFKAKMQSVLEYFQYRDLSGDLRRKIKSYYVLTWRQAPDLHDEGEILNDLSQPLKSRIFHEIGQNAVKEIPIFQGFDEECIGFIYSRLKHANFVENEKIYGYGDYASDMYLIVSGKVVITPKSENPTDRHGTQKVSKISREVTKGDIFGEVGLFPDVLGYHRHETATSQTWTIAYSLNYQDVQDLETAYPQPYARLKEFCILKAMEFRIKHGESDSSALASRSNKSVHSCKIRMRTSQLKQDLIRLKEADLLIPSAGEDGSEVINLFVPAPGAGREGARMEAQWLCLSCVVSESGEILCIEHTIEGLASQRPKSLGFLVRGISTFRTLEHDNTASFSGWGKNKVLGCEIVLLPSPETTPGGTFNGLPELSKEHPPLSPSLSSSGAEGKGHKFYTWSQESYEALRIAVKDWLGATTSLTTPKSSPVRSIQPAAPRSLDANPERATPSHSIIAHNRSRHNILKGNGHTNGTIYEAEDHMDEVSNHSAGDLFLDKATDWSPASAMNSPTCTQPSYADFHGAPVPHNGDMVPRRLLDAANEEIRKLRREVGRLQQCMRAAATLLQGHEPTKEPAQEKQVVPQDGEPPRSRLTPAVIVPEDTLAGNEDYDVDDPSFAAL